MPTRSEYSEKEACEPLVIKTGSLSTTKIEDSSCKPIDNVRRNKSVILLEHKKNDKNMVKWKLVPPDGGWGWLVLFGATMVNILVPGTIKSFGVLFVEFLEAFDSTTAEGMWIPALCYFLYSSLGPVSSILSVRYSYRLVTILGGICAAGGMILSFWASSVYFLYASYGVLVGIGAGLSFPPTVYIVCSYFLKLRGVANGICISGSAFGSIIIPPILRILLVTYGYRGAVLLMGGLTLNVFVAALFYDRVEKHMKKEQVTSDEENEEKRAKFTISNNESLTSLHNTPQNDSFLEHIEKATENFNRSASSVAMQNIQPQQRERKVSMPQSRQEILKAKAKESMNSNSTLHPVSEKGNSTAMDFYSQTRLPSSRRRSIAPPRSTSTSSFQYVSTPYHGSTLTLQPEIFASSFSLRSNKSKTILEEEVQKPQLLDLSLLKDPIYLIILISNATNAISYTNFIILLPSYAKSLGFDKDQGAMLLSIVSAFDLVGRIGGSALSDLTSFPKCYYFVGGLLLSGISLSLLPLFINYWIIAAFSAIFGLASGTYVGITAIVMADMLGSERLQSTYGMGLFVNGILQLIGPPLCGLWYSQVNSFVSLFICLGIALTAGASLWSIIPCIGEKK
ncbi:monocarboxylate transporter 13 [Diorhabda sublineata]|uniref:monocarboxylate transporter 13 n=1 Tax=Diorhabda sublineata TaxID=1163346 RepID=UPI0024E13EB2|nr:monocarboxylate transporter 13 [Diorhabda sublineata]